MASTTDVDVSSAAKISGRTTESKGGWLKVARNALLATAATCATFSACDTFCPSVSAAVRSTLCSRASSISPDSVSRAWASAASAASGCGVSCLTTGLATGLAGAGLWAMQSKTGSSSAPGVTDGTEQIDRERLREELEVRYKKEAADTKTRYESAAAEARKEAKAYKETQKGLSTIAAALFSQRNQAEKTLAETKKELAKSQDLLSAAEHKTSKLQAVYSKRAHKAE